MLRRWPAPVGLGRRREAAWHQCRVSRYLAHKKASFRPLQILAIHPVSLRFAPCQSQKSILFIGAIQRETLH